MTYSKGKWEIMKSGLGLLCIKDPSDEGLVISSTYPEDQVGLTPELASLIAAAPDMYEALKEISKGRGRYSLDRLTHAENTIDDMKTLALEALAKAEKEVK